MVVPPSNFGFIDSIIPQHRNKNLSLTPQTFKHYLITALSNKSVKADRSPPTTRFPTIRGGRGRGRGRGTRKEKTKRQQKSFSLIWTFFTGRIPVTSTYTLVTPAVRRRARRWKVRRTRERGRPILVQQQLLLRYRIFKLRRFFDITVY